MLGDAYVSIVPSPINNIAIDSGEVGAMIYNFDYIAGAVTALPSGYSTESTLPAVKEYTQEHVLTNIIYEPNADFSGWVISTIADDFNGIVVLPSEITDVMYETGLTLPVTEVKSKAADSNNTITGFVIPACINKIAEAAFYKCTATDYYVMNPNCEIAAGAMGADGTWVNKWYNNTTLGPFVMNTAAGAATIHGAAGSTAEAYVTSSTFYTNASHAETALKWSASTELGSEVTLTFNGTKYYFTSGSEVTIPGASVDGDQLTVAWKIGDTTYLPGDTMTITEDTTLEPVTIAKPQTSTEVGLKLADSWKGLSMRFKATFGVDDYATLASLGTVELGMLITPARYVSYAGAFTKEALAEFKVGETTYALGEDAYVDVALNGYFSKTDDEYTFAARLQNFSDTTLAKNPDFAAVMYATVTTADGATFTVYGDFNFAANNSVLDVAKNTSTEGQTDTIKGAVAALIKTLKGEEA